MKARWTGGDFAEMGYAPLPFTERDVRLIYLGLAKQTTRTGVMVAERR